LTTFEVDLVILSGFIAIIVIRSSMVQKEKPP